MKNNIEKFRRENGWTQDDLATKTYTTKSTVSRWEKGISEPDIGALKNLAKIFGKTIDEVLNVDDSAQKEPSVTINTNPQSLGLKILTLNCKYTGFGDKEKKPANYRWINITFLLIMFVIVSICTILISGASARSPIMFKSVSSANRVIFGLLGMLLVVFLFIIYRIIVHKMKMNQFKLGSSGVKAEIYKKGFKILSGENKVKTYLLKAVINIHQDSDLNNKSRTGWSLFGGMNTVNTVSKLSGFVQVWFEDGEKLYLQTNSEADLQLIKTLKAAQ